ncbi:MAG: hypothetical protein IKC81_05695 [Paludibacteraceae bacterium]|nr:hypothetical protein [Paludibacteraceae bacterium]
MADNNILIRVTGEADLSEAQLQIKELSNRSKELEAQMLKTAQAEREDAASIKALGLSGKELQQALAKNAEYYRGLRKEMQGQVTANEKNIKSLKQLVSNTNAMNGVGSKMTQQIRAIREQLMQMEMAGDTSSQAFIDLSVRAAELTDQMGDTQQQINILASDTKNLDAAMSVGSGIAGAFNAATSAAALLGGESEELQDAFLKVQAALAVLNGVQQVANVLNKDSAANVVIRHALQKLFNKEKTKEVALTGASTAATAAETAAKGASATATTAATAATWSFNAALLANPVMLIVAGVAALVAGLAYLTSALSSSAKEQRNFNGIMEETEKRIKNIGDSSDYAAKLAEAEGKTWKEVAKIQENGLLNQYNTAVRAYNKMVKLKQDSWFGISDEEQEQMDKLKEIYKAKNEELVKFRQDVHVREIAERVKNNEEKLKAEKEAIQKRKEEIKEAEEQLKDVRIALMKDSTAQEIAQIKRDFQKKISAITGNSKAEIALRKALAEQMNREIAKVQTDADNELQRLQIENNAKIAEIYGGEDVYEAKKQSLEDLAELEIKAINESEDNAKLKAEKILAVEHKLHDDLKKLQNEHSANTIAKTTAQANNRIKAEENAAIAILNSENATNEQIKQARETLAAHDKNLRQVRMDELNAQYQAGLISEQEFQDAKLDIEREALEEQAEILAEQRAQQQELAMTILQGIGDLANEIFGAIQDHIQSELEALDEMYTTDAQEAKEDAQKKYISEKELEDKKIALKRKAAAAEKASAVFSIGLNTAMAIMQAIAQFGPPPSPMGIAGIAIASALGATQLAIALAKPLPKYAKGRKGGAGEYALVGEKGPELMYIPQGASIVPNNKLHDPRQWTNYGLPSIPKYSEPIINGPVDTSILPSVLGYMIDYDKLGRAVGSNLPKQKTVTVHVDSSGVAISDDGNYHKIMNKKYCGAWN